MCRPKIGIRAVVSVRRRRVDTPKRGRRIPITSRDDSDLYIGGASGVQIRQRARWAVSSIFPDLVVRQAIWCLKRPKCSSSSHLSNLRFVRTQRSSNLRRTEVLADCQTRLVLPATRAYRAPRQQRRSQRQSVHLDQKQPVCGRGAARYSGVPKVRRSRGAGCDRFQCTDRRVPEVIVAGLRPRPLEVGATPDLQCPCPRLPRMLGRRCGGQGDPSTVRVRGAPGTAHSPLREPARPGSERD